MVPEKEWLCECRCHNEKPKMKPVRVREGNCGCPHGCNRLCDEYGRCPYCWDDGLGCPVLFFNKVRITEVR